MGNNMVWGHTNYLWNTTTSVMVTPVSTTYPATRLFDQQTSRRCWSPGTSVQIRVDLGATPSDIELLALVGCTTHRTVQAWGMLAATWTTPDYGPVTLAEGVVGNYWSRLPAATAYRYWKFVVTGVGGDRGVGLDGYDIVAITAPVYTKMGEVYVGRAVEASVNPSPEYQRQAQFGAVSLQTARGVAWNYRTSRQRWALGFGWQYVDVTTRNQLLELDKSVRGQLHPFLLVPDPTSDAQAYWVRKDGGMQYSHTGRSTGYDDYGFSSLSVIEEPTPDDS